MSSEMNCYKIHKIKDVLVGNDYVGRGIVIGRTEDASKCVFAYFIMGRSENSRNRVFMNSGEELYTRPFHEEKLEDKTLIIYPAIKRAGKKLIVTNGDQTETIYNAIKEGRDVNEALMTRSFEPDAPNFTPRISGVMDLSEPDFTYSMSILKSIDELGTSTVFNTFNYKSKAGLAHFIHTYEKNGNPIPSFVGEPKRVKMYNDIDKFSNELWTSLDKENKISLYVRYIDLNDGSSEMRVFNVNYK